MSRLESDVKKIYYQGTFFDKKFFRKIAKKKFNSMLEKQSQFVRNHL